MSVPENERRLAAIMFTDMVGFTALTQRNEAQAMQALAEQRNLVRPILRKHNGVEIKTMGDAFLVEFGSALEATRCAFEIQESLHELNSSPGRRENMVLRVGIHLGDVIHEKSDIYGDAVNIASRIEPLAPPGGICVSQQVYDAVKNKFEFPFTTLGKRNLKNVAEPVEVFRAVLPWEEGVERNQAVEKNRIAVLPFANMSPDPADGYFADGMTEELITTLSSVKGLTVIARTSVMKYRMTPKTASEIGRELNVGTLMEGSVRKSGSRVRIATQLIDAVTEGHVWAQTYDRQLDDVFVVQSEIAQKVATELEVKLLDSERRALEKKSTDSTEAYTCFLQGRELYRQGDERSLRRAAELYQKAIDIDPSFARAHCGLASCFWMLANEGYEPYEQSIPKAELPVKRALALDPDLAEAHAILSLIYFLEDNLVGCESEGKEAVALNPSLPEGYFLLSNVAFLRGEGEEGLKLSEIAYRLDPVGPQYVARLGEYYFYFGMESKALEFWEKTSQLAPAGTYRAMTSYHLAKGDIARAKEFHAKAEALEPTSPWVAWMRGFIAARDGNKDAALRTIREIEEKWVSASDLNSVGFIYYALGDFDSYFTYMNRAIDQHLVQYIYPMYSPLFEKGRADPRYQEMLNRMKRTYWPGPT